MTATKLIALRVAIGIGAAAAYTASPRLAYLGLSLFLLATVLDMADGIVAEWQNHAKPFGGFLDISADQCIEYLLWIVFTDLRLVPVWIPAFIIIRNSFINLLRMSAIRRGMPMFGDGGMLVSSVGLWLVGARLSRGVMVLVKTAGFVAITVCRSQATAQKPAGSAPVWHAIGVSCLAGLAVIHLVRGAIIVRESRTLLPEFMWSAVQAAIGREAER